MEDLSHDLMGQWCNAIKDCVKVYSDKRTKLWSFEVKVKINRSNVREAFFKQSAIHHGQILDIWLQAK